MVTKSELETKILWGIIFDSRRGRKVETWPLDQLYHLIRRWPREHTREGCVHVKQDGSINLSFINLDTKKTLNIDLNNAHEITITRRHYQVIQMFRELDYQDFEDIKVVKFDSECRDVEPVSSALDWLEVLEEYPHSHPLATGPEAEIAKILCEEINKEIVKELYEECVKAAANNPQLEEALKALEKRNDL